MTFSDYKDHLVGAVKSWTMRFNGGMAAIGALCGPFQDTLVQQLPIVQQWVSHEAMTAVGYVMLGLTTVNAALRAKTNQSLGARGQAPADAPKDQSNG